MSSVSKPCTKSKCDGMMVWNERFRSFGPNGGPPYRPAWVCSKCKKHDYVREPNSEELDIADWRRKLCD